MKREDVIRILREQQIQLLDLKKHLEALLGCAVEIGKPQSLRPEFRTLVLQEAVRVIEQ